MTQRGVGDGQLEPEEVGGPIAFAPNWKARQAEAAAPGPCSGGDSGGDDFQPDITTASSHSYHP